MIIIGRRASAISILALDLKGTPEDVIGHISMMNIVHIGFQKWVASIAISLFQISAVHLNQLKNRPEISMLLAITINFNIGDIVEVRVPISHKNAQWNRLRFKITNIMHGQYIIEGTVINIPSHKLVGHPTAAVGSNISWGDPGSLKLVKPATKKNKYFSPFSGKWI